MSRLRTHRRRARRAAFWAAKRRASWHITAHPIVPGQRWYTTPLPNPIDANSQGSVQIAYLAQRGRLIVMIREVA